LNDKITPLVRRHEVKSRSRHIVLFLLVFVLSATYARAQEKVEEVEIEGELRTALVMGTDTFIIATLDNVTVTSPREFSSRDEYRRYLKYKRYAGKVYPYGSEAIRILANYEADTEGMSKRKKKKYVRKLQRDLNNSFKEPLKSLTKTHGRILVKMIEKELDQSLHQLLKELRGGFYAGTWQTKGKLFGYDLKEKYEVGQDPILDAVMQDFDISLDYN